MPFYEYECSACRFYVEVLQKVSDPPLKKCPSCGKSKLAKLVSAPVFRLKGAGWYETDFKAEGETKRNLAEDKEAKEAKEAKESESKSESTAAKPAETKAATETPKKAAAKAAPVKKAAAKPSKPKPSKAKPAARKKASRR